MCSDAHKNHVISFARPSSAYSHKLRTAAKVGALHLERHTCREDQVASELFLSLCLDDALSKVNYLKLITYHVTF
jgi:hypothetical protein